MGYYLLDHRNPNGDHFYTTRRNKIKGQIIHITAGLEDTDLIGPDHSAESVVNYAATTPREVSWHTSSDTDGFINLLPYDYTAWQCIDYNSSTAGHEISKLETNWKDDNPKLVQARLYWAAEAIRPNLLKYSIPMRKATKAELDHAINTNGPPVGLIGHWELDPTRRSDPGLSHGVDTFPWTQFINLLRNAPKPDTQTIKTIRGEAMLVQAQKGVVLIIGDQRYGLNSTQVNELRAQGVPYVNLTSDALYELGTRVLEGTPQS